MYLDRKIDTENIEVHFVNFTINSTMHVSLNLISLPPDAKYKGKVMFTARIRRMGREMFSVCQPMWGEVPRS